MTHEREAALQQVTDLFRSTAPKLFREAQVGVGGNHGAAEELVQEVFQAFWSARDRICELAADEQRAWLFGTLRHKVVDQFRRTRHEIAVEPEEFKLTYQARSVPAATRQILVGEVLDRCWRVIEQMPPTQQHVFWLRAHEWKTAEIAEYLGITASTVRDHYRRGMQRLNREVGKGKEIFAALDDNELDEGVTR
jgi:RNA polymerase sigma factor (sigma-70 family)